MADSIRILKVVIIPLMLKFYFSNIHTDRPDLSDREMLLGVEAYFSIIMDNEIFFSEQEFPILEFASQLAAWCQDAAGDFHYESLEIDENPMISFVRQENDDYAIAALDSNFQSDKLWPHDLLVQRGVSFCENVVFQVERELGLDVRQVVWPAR